VSTPFIRELTLLVLLAAVPLAVHAQVEPTDAISREVSLFIPPQDITPSFPDLVVVSRARLP